jgi:hypothetical protein
VFSTSPRTVAGTAQSPKIGRSRRFGFSFILFGRLAGCGSQEISRLESVSLFEYFSLI